MNRPTPLRLLPAITLLLALFAAPYCFAGPHGGGGGGGFHGGGGGGGYHGGGGGPHGGAWGNAYHGGWGSGYHGGWNGYRGGGHYGGWRGGYYPARGWYGWGGWGYPGWGWGGWGWSGWNWGIGVSVGWGGYWPAYPYYGYAPAVPAAPVYYPCEMYYTYQYCASVNFQPVPPAAVRVTAASAPQPAPEAYAAADARPPARPTDVTVMNASYRPTASAQTGTRYIPANQPSSQGDTLRPAVQNVIRALLAMPPAARDRQLASGRYNNFSPEELEFVRYVVSVPQAK